MAHVRKQRIGREAMETGLRAVMTLTAIVAALAGLARADEAGDKERLAKPRQQALPSTAAGLPTAGSPRGDTAVQQSTRPAAPASQPARAADGMVALNFPTEIEVRGLVDYVSQRVGVKILYDEQIANKKINIRGPGEVPVSSLLGLLESALKMKGMALEDADVPGWKRIVTTAKLPLIAHNEQDAEAAIAKYGAGTAVTQAFLLKHADPQQVDTVIKPFLTQPGANSVAIKDPSVLIVTDYAANILKVTKLVNLLDQPKPDVVLEFLPVKNMEAAALGQQLSGLFTARAKAAGTNRGGASGVEITSDARTNQLLLVGTRPQVDEVIALARALDVPLGVSTQVYALRYASAERVERLAKELIDPIDAKRLFRSAVDNDGNLLIITGTPRIHEQVAAIHRKLDVPGRKAGGGLVKFYKLKNVKATEPPTDSARSIRSAALFR